MDTHKDYLQTETRYIINCGANDGSTADPLYPIFMKHKYPGIAIELQKDLFEGLKVNLPESNILKVNQALEPHTVQQLFRDNRVPNRPLLFKMDIDGYDYPVVRALFIDRSNNSRTQFEPAFVLVETNEKIPPPINFYTRYRAQVPYLLDHHPKPLEEEEQLLSYEFVRVILPSNYSSISGFIETILLIYQTNFSPMKTMNDGNSQEIKTIN
ncbi:unnamed protein product [Rotaria sp. Silwood2]|nr:unnamed protein product [Rotaria sp. Silwood2]